MTQKKIALVTGASRGIGRAVAEALARASNVDYVVGTATTQTGADAIDRRFQELQLNGGGKVLDIADPASVTALIGVIAMEQGALPSVLVNNAGINRDNLLLRMKDEEWRAVIDTNLTGTFYTTRACLKGMMKVRWGRIINIGSVVGSSGNPGQTNYTAAKAALIGFGKSLAKEVATRGITVNTIAPGFIETDMVKSLNDDQRAAIMQAIPMQRTGTPEEVAAVAVFLASDSAAYISGQTLHVNGAMY